MNASINEYRRHLRDDHPEAYEAHLGRQRERYRINHAGGPVEEEAIGITRRRQHLVEELRDLLIELDATTDAADYEAGYLTIEEMSAATDERRSLIQRFPLTPTTARGIPLSMPTKDGTYITAHLNPHDMEDFHRVKAYMPRAE